MVEIVPVAEHHAEGFRASLDVVMRERRYLAQVEAPPLERIEAFVRECADLAAAFERWMERDARFAAWLEGEVRGLGHGALGEAR